MKPKADSTFSAEDLSHLRPPRSVSHLPEPERQSALTMKKSLKEAGCFIRQNENGLDAILDFSVPLAAQIIFKDGFCTFKTKLVSKCFSDQLALRLHQVNGCLGGGCLFCAAGDIFFRHSTYYGENAMTLSHCQALISTCTASITQCRSWLKDAVPQKDSKEKQP